MTCELRSRVKRSSSCRRKERSKRRNTSKPTGRHRVFARLPGDSSCEVLTKTFRAPCRNCPDARGDRAHLAHVLSEGIESRMQNRCAVVMEDFCSRWIQSYPTKSKHAQSLQRFVPPDHVNTTPQMTCFRGAEVCTKWLQEKVTINSYSMTTSWSWKQVTS